MENIAEFYPMITECVVNLIRAVVAVLFGVLILPWVKNSAIPWLKEKQLYGMICKFVRAAEKLGDTGEIDKSSKLDYVITLLKSRGIEFTQEIRALIESAVGELDDLFASQIEQVVETVLDGNVETTVHVSEDGGEDEAECESCVIGMPDQEASDAE